MRHDFSLLDATWRRRSSLFVLIRKSKRWFCAGAAADVDISIERKAIIEVLRKATRSMRPKRGCCDTREGRELGEAIDVQMAERWPVHESGNGTYESQ